MQFDEFDYQRHSLLIWDFCSGWFLMKCINHDYTYHSGDWILRVGEFALFGTLLGGPEVVWGAEPIKYPDASSDEEYRERYYDTLSNFNRRFLMNPTVGMNFVLECMKVGWAPEDTSGYAWYPAMRSPNWSFSDFVLNRAAEIIKTPPLLHSDHRYFGSY